MSDTTAEVERTTSFDEIICSICLDSVSDSLDRSIAKLHCGHRFHLDCIGSAFNVKGSMQCPNCRKVEAGRWLYASGPPPSVTEIVMEDWLLNEEQHGIPYPEFPHIHYCPFSGLARAHSAFEVLESPQTAYYHIPRPASSVPQSYVAYFRPVQPASSAANGTIENANFTYQANGVSHPNVFPVTNMQYPNAVHNSQLVTSNNAHPSSIDQAPVAAVTRSMRDIGAMTRSGSYMQPSHLGHGSQSHGRLQQSQTIHPQTNPLGMPAAIIPGVARFNGRSAFPSPSSVPTNSVSNRNGNFFMFPSQGSSVQSSHQMESSFPSGAGSDSNGTGNFWNGRWS